MQKYYHPYKILSPMQNTITHATLFRKYVGRAVFSQSRGQNPVVPASSDNVVKIRKELAGNGIDRVTDNLHDRSKSKIIIN